MSADGGRERKVVLAQGQACAWCGTKLSPRYVHVIERDAGPIGFCATCDRRYARPHEHPYMRRCLDAQGR